MLNFPLKRLRFQQSSPFSSNNKKFRNDIVTEGLSRQDIMETSQDSIGVKTDNLTQPTGERQEVREGNEQEASPLVDVIQQFAAALAQGRSCDPTGPTISPFDGTYSATQFFQTFDRKMEDASMEEPEKLLRLPNYLVRQPLELFRKLRLADRSYFQVRQILLDLYPESSEASFAKYFAMKLTGQANLETYYREKTAIGLQLGLPQEVILETLTEGLPFSDQRLVRVVPPENRGEWFRLVQRIHGPSVPTTRPREDQPPTMSVEGLLPESSLLCTNKDTRLPSPCYYRIEQSFSPFSSPVTLVTKRDKTKRFCIDYRKVNELISSDVHPLPRIEDILDRLAQAKYFSTADISSAYWQVPIHPDSRPLLAFATLEGLYQPTRLPFGLKTSPQVYERAISQVLQRHGLDCVAHYFDDFIIYSNTLEEHQNHLRQFFAFCEAEKLQLNFAKCEFFKQSIDFLGYTITAGTTTPLTRNTDIIHAIKQPHNRKTLQSFLGAVNVYNKFIPDYARLRAPLNNLLKKDVVWIWDETCQKAFIDLKGNLTQHPILHLYKEGLPCQVYCDASTLGIAGILKQVHPDGNVYPVQYFSRTLRPHEKNYSISELECLAIVESVEKFRIYLMGRKFTIFSDHHALQWLKTIKNPSGRLFRWSLRLSSYEYEVRYIKGKQQYEADLLSRNPFCGFLDASLIKTHQPPPSRESNLTIDRNGLHTVSRKGVTKIIIPKPLIQQLLQTVHTQYNHPGISQMSRLISTQYYWQGMSKDIKQKVKTCPTCQLTKRPLGPTYGELSQPPEAKEPFDLLSLDTIAGFAKYGNTKIYLHVVVDHFSRYAWTFPSKSTSITTYQQTYSLESRRQNKNNLDRHFGNEEPEDEISLTTCGLVDPPFSENEVKLTAFKFGKRISSGPEGIDNTSVKALCFGSSSIFTYLKNGSRSCIKFCVKNEIKCADAFRMLTVAYGEATLDRSNVYRWYKMFSEGREDVNDEERAGRPSTSTTDEKINEVEKMILANRRITVREVAEDLNISIGSCHSIFINDLGMSRVAAKFVPKLLNCDQKQHRMNIANEMLDSVRDDLNLLQRVITGDEAWVYGYDVETKPQSSQWKLPHEPKPKKARQVRSNVKVLLTVFVDCRGVVHREFLPQGRTVNKEYYLQVMRNLSEAIRQKRPDLWKNKNWLLHHDNAPAHTSLLVRDFLAKNNTLMMPQPPYSPDLAPCDFFLFPKLKRPMKGRRYATLDEIKTASKEELKKIF
ncbi:hypothetical protein LAZ67_18001973 [Cordylochernes scorpioides]|uniref:RNA-directed DNA polymerase n=1 Tax=Cordylochernes scorpioides TaxID=51811 RepID=A0ABY6LHQ4_9ARAC|nr:hypothetical protein LAZ67_18001973 [Cordylochernes scorpioides]